MINIKSSVQIYRPLQEVFEFISTPENDFLWQYGTLASVALVGSVMGRGGSFTSNSNFMGQRSQSTFEVIQYELNKSYGFKSLSGPLQSITSYGFEEIKGNTLITISIKATVVNLAQLNESVFEKKMTKQLRENLALLKSILEIG